MKVSSRLGVRAHLLRFLANTGGAAMRPWSATRRRGLFVLPEIRGKGRQSAHGYLESGSWARISLTAALGEPFTQIEGNAPLRLPFGQDKEEPRAARDNAGRGKKIAPLPAFCRLRIIRPTDFPLQSGNPVFFNQFFDAS